MAKRPAVQLPACSGPASSATDETDTTTGQGKRSRQGVGNAASLPATARRGEPVALAYSIAPKLTMRT